jgi:hypothetical protein
MFLAVTGPAPCFKFPKRERLGVRDHSGIKVEQPHAANQYQGRRARSAIILSHPAMLDQNRC